MFNFFEHTVLLFYCYYTIICFTMYPFNLDCIFLITLFIDILSYCIFIGANTGLPNLGLARGLT